MIALALTACSDDAKTPAAPADAATTTTGPDAATGSDAASGADAGPGGDGAAPAETGAPYVEPTNCNLVNDTFGPGQYSDGCVKREWVTPYAGKYTSPNCELTIDVTGGVAATFTLKVTGATLPGTYANDWDGASAGGAGNDSYYRFTTDATFATTKTLNFTAGKSLGNGDESAVSFRVENIDTTPTFTGYYGEVKGGQNTEAQCGAYTKQ